MIKKTYSLNPEIKGDNYHKVNNVEEVIGSYVKKKRGLKVDFHSGATSIDISGGSTQSALSVFHCKNTTITIRSSYTKPSLIVQKVTVKIATRKGSIDSIVEELNTALSEHTLSLPQLVEVEKS